MWAAVGECWPWPKFKFSKTVEVGWYCYDLQLCQCEIATDEIQERERERELSNIKRARVSAMMGSKPRKTAEARQSVSALIRN